MTTINFQRLGSPKHGPASPSSWSQLESPPLFDSVFSLLPPGVRELVQGLPPSLISRLEEIRLRQERPLVVRAAEGDYGVTAKGEVVRDISLGYRVNHGDLTRAISLISGCSVYALEEELRHGYITLPGGHRVGLVGKAVVELGRVKTLKSIAGLNYRVAREIPGVADKIMPYLVKVPRVYHTLILSPPQGGKTTLLRDILRQLSDGVPALGFPGVNVGVVDERSELAGCLAGVPQLQVGQRTDVLDGCPKAEGMMMLLRSMAPRVIATDELGSKEDVGAVNEILNAGVTLVTTVHGYQPEELFNRPHLGSLMEARVFDRIIILSRRLGVGTVEAVMDAAGRVLWGNRGKGREGC